MTERTNAGRNWAGNLAYGAARIARPASVDELAEVVAAAAGGSGAEGATRVRALGSRHSFNRIADTDGLLIETAGLPPRVEIDAAARTVRVSAGQRYGEVAEALDREGWALSNLASLPHISVAGAVATGTHGSGDRRGSLATQVAALELVTADGSVRWLRRGEPDFDGAVVALGALGIVTSLELDLEPTYEVAQTVFERLPIEAVLADLDAVTGLATSTSLFTTWRDPDVIDQLWLKQRTDAAASAALPGVLAAMGARPASAKRHPLPGVSAEHCTDQLGVPGPWFARLPHFKLGFTPSNGDELQSEFLVPREHAADAIAAVRGLAGSIAPLLQVNEIRTVAADTLWLSSSFERPAVGLHFTWLPDQPAVESLLPTLQAALAPFEARPHWGKLFDVTEASERMPQLYARWNDFRSLRARYDPNGVFRNELLERLGL
ncbi:FAD-binding protein [Agromyces aureus]|uniref:FAD-binding protein n=1 Tax=Agromyces aureus TaxID=453304 RepID=A0A191WDA4_9MICO|nr:FAD-binding protein [Agromyces aureus]ANJ26207.1 FAD-binding protein [Agromyces aureus]